MKVYTISGLGADQRVFDFLKLNLEQVPLNWIDPNKNELIESYALRLSEEIDQNEPFALMGVSFGGLIATEITKISNPEFTILVSTCEKSSELPWYYRVIGKLHILRIIPSFLFSMPYSFATWLFGAQNRKLLKAILEISDLDFTKWAVQALCSWGNTESISNLIKIGGTKDKLLPCSQHTIKVEGGEHFMIVDRADELSHIINTEISSYLSPNVSRG